MEKDRSPSSVGRKDRQKLGDLSTTDCATIEDMLGWLDLVGRPTYHLIFSAAQKRNPP